MCVPKGICKGNIPDTIADLATGFLSTVLERFGSPTEATYFD